MNNNSNKNNSNLNSNFNNNSNNKNNNTNNSNNNSNNNLKCNKDKYADSIGCKKLESISTLIFTFIIYIYTLLNFISYSNSPAPIIDFKTNDGYNNISDNQIRRKDLLHMIFGFSILMLILLCISIYNAFIVFKSK